MLNIKKVYICMSMCIYNFFLKIMLNLSLIYVIKKKCMLELI